MEDMEKRIREMFQREKDKKLENYRQLNRYVRILHGRGDQGPGL